MSQLFLLYMYIFLTTQFSYILSTKFKPCMKNFDNRDFWKSGALGWLEWFHQGTVGLKSIYKERRPTIWNFDGLLAFGMCKHPTGSHQLHLKKRSS